MAVPSRQKSLTTFDRRNIRQLCNLATSQIEHNRSIIFVDNREIQSSSVEKYLLFAELNEHVRGIKSGLLESQGKPIVS